MMAVLEIVSFCLIAALCCLCTKSDLSTGIIHNKTLVVFFAVAVVVDAFYYGVFARGLVVEFALNFFLVAVASLLLYFSRTFAGGDCKMAVVLAALFPARYYLALWGVNITLFLTIALSLFAGYCYLLASALFAIAKGKTVMTLDYVKGSLIGFSKSYISALSYISLIGCAAMLPESFGAEVSVWVVRGLCLAVALCVGRFQELKRAVFVVPAALAVITFSLATKSLPVSINPENCCLVLFLVLCQTAIKPSVYERIEVAQLKRGMILTTMASIPMQASVTKGLPGVSTEDLKSRLTEEEVESVKIWAKATRTDTLTIVRKIPFAIFISAGVFLYCLLGSVTTWM